MKAALQMLISCPVRADNPHVVTTRTWIVMIVAVAAVAFGGWMLLAPQAKKASDAAGEGAEELVGTVSTAYFTAAEASLEAQRHATGSYAGTPIQAPLRLVRVDATTYCVELDQPTQVTHLEGPGGSPAPGPCS
jgi:hypothetical protein